ncbi:hypothetical protein [Antribacter soli]|uniref:hypothetical protein n=1 Tax=Antribacter soli TaxID=2910976 RepID=UPI0027E113EE|nr:hypothetical protein [Antribacter soli]
MNGSPAEAKLARVRVERRLGADRVLVHAHARRPQGERAERESAEPVADRHDRAGRGRLDQPARLVEEEAVCGVHRDRAVRARAVLGEGQEPGQDPVQAGRGAGR